MMLPEGQAKASESTLACLLYIRSREVSGLSPFRRAPVGHGRWGRAKASEFQAQSHPLNRCLLAVSPNCHWLCWPGPWSLHLPMYVRR